MWCSESDCLCLLAVITRSSCFCCRPVAACLLLHLSVTLTVNKAIEILREHRGGGAIQTVKVTGGFISLNFNKDSVQDRVKQICRWLCIVYREVQWSWEKKITWIPEFCHPYVKFWVFFLRNLRKAKFFLKPELNIQVWISWEKSEFRREKSLIPIRIKKNIEIIIPRLFSQSARCL